MKILTTVRFVSARQFSEYRSTLVLTVLLAFAALPTTILAKGRFATIEMVRIVRECEQFRKAASRIEAQRDEYQEMVEKERLAIKKISDEIDVTKEPDKKSRLEKSKRTKLLALQKTFQEMQEKLRFQEKQEMKKLTSQIYSVVEKLAAAKGVEMVLERQYVYNPGNCEDLTDDLLRSLEPSVRGKASGKKDDLPVSSRSDRSEEE